MIGWVDQEKSSLNDTHFICHEKAGNLYKCGPQDLGSSLLVSKVEKLSLVSFHIFHWKDFSNTKLMSLKSVNSNTTNYLLKIFHEIFFPFHCSQRSQNFFFQCYGEFLKKIVLIGNSRIFRLSNCSFFFLKKKFLHLKKFSSTTGLTLFILESFSSKSNTFFVFFNGLILFINLSKDNS